MKTQPLYPWQKDAVEWASKRRRIAIFMDPRLGKSRVASRWVKHWELSPVLLVAPYNSHLDWKEELDNEGWDWFAAQRPNEWSLISEFGPPEGWTLAGFEGIRENLEILKLNWAAIILDESVTIKSPKSRISRYLTDPMRIDHVRHRAILSGLPNPESSLDYFQQFKFLMGGLLGCKNYWKFREDFYLQGIDGWTELPGTLEAIRKTVHASAFVRTWKQVGLKDEKIYKRSVVPMDTACKKAHIRALKQYEREVKNLKGKVEWTNFAPVAAIWAAQAAGKNSNKRKELVRWCVEELAGQSIVVWFRFNEEIYTAKADLEAAGVSVATLDGSLKKRERDESVKSFRSGKSRVLLAQGKLAKYGLKLHRASAAIYYSNWWDLDTRFQTEARVRLPTKVGGTLILDLITENSVDEDVVDSIRTKDTNAKYFTQRLWKLIGKRLSNV